MSRLAPIAAFALVLSADLRATAGDNVLRDEDDEVQVTVPDNWLPMKADGWFRIRAGNPRLEGWVGIQHKKKDDKTPDLKSFAEATFRVDANTGWIRNSRMEGPKSVTVNGHPALQYAQTCQLGPKKLDVVVLRTYIELDGSWNAVICWCPPGNVAKCSTDFSSIISSFSNVGAPPTTAPMTKPSGT